MHRFAQQCSARSRYVVRAMCVDVQALWRIVLCIAKWIQVLFLYINQVPSSAMQMSPLMNPLLCA